MQQQSEKYKKITLILSHEVTLHDFFMVAVVIYHSEFSHIRSRDVTQSRFPDTSEKSPWQRPVNYQLSCCVYFDNQNQTLSYVAMTPSGSGPGCQSGYRSGDL